MVDWHSAMKPILRITFFLLSIVLLQNNFLFAENGHEAWLRYARLDSKVIAKYASLPDTVVVLGDSGVLHSAQGELIRGMNGMLGKTVRPGQASLNGNAFVLATTVQLQEQFPRLEQPKNLVPDGFWITTTKLNGKDCVVVAAVNDRGVLYGVFSLLREIGLDQLANRLNEIEQPSAPVRWVNQWDNLDGTIERGYAGRSIFFDNDDVRADLSRAGEYARILASVGINGCTVSNVNASPRLLTDEFLPKLARIADAFRPWGVKLSIAIDVSSPKTIGGLDTFDPLDPNVAGWWRAKFDQIYKAVPDFGGVVVKADSEGRLGPSTYGRTPVDAANVIARALKPHGGLVFYRAFVYNHHLDWRDPKNDRAKAAYDNFHPLDGKFDDNVIIQIKHGPIDFQVREPASPLFSGLEKTNEAIELQVTQEYTGQQHHLCFLIPMWKEVLDFDLRANGRRTPVKEILSGGSFDRPTGGYVAVVNVGLDANWLAHPLAMANLYGFARLAWNPDISSSQIADEWTKLTFGADPLVVRTTSDLLLSSWRTYENYTGPLGLQTLTNILGSHYGPGIESSEENGWGQWHRAYHDAVGMDRSGTTGTGFAGQYPPAVAKIYESVDTTPDDLLLFFHHEPYTHVLHSGKTVIQTLYDLHYEGAAKAAENVRDWEQLKGHIDDERYNEVFRRLQYQAGHAIVWRDAVCSYFQRVSGIADAKGRVGHYAGRVEAEAMQATGYVPIDITPPENASGGKGIECPPAAGKCTVSFRYEGPSGRREIDVEYFDQLNGVSKYRVFVGDKIVDEWAADMSLPAIKPNGDSSTRRRIHGVELQKGDVIQVEGTPDGEEHAAMDYVEVLPDER